MRISRFFLVVALMLLGFAGTAHADSLDGDWCNADNEKLTIEGDDIILPDGKRVTGNYARHQFTFSSPSGAWHGGKDILLQQHSEQSMSLLSAGNSAAGEAWKRCNVNS